MDIGDDMKCGFVSLTGRPNVGKSTLLNALLGTKLAITSNKVGTTRHVIEGIYNDDDSQIIFVDTPGIQKPLHKLGNVLNQKAYRATHDVDIILFLADAEKGYGDGDKLILKSLENAEVPVFLLLNKVDRIKKELLFPMIDQYQKLFPFKEIIPVSALKQQNLDDLLKTIKKYLPEQDPLFEKEEWTNVSTKFLVGELVREKVLELTRDEVPHAVTCFVETYESDEEKAHIGVVIAVDRENLKKMIIGKNGQMLKEIGTRARLDMEALLDKKVFLETYVKTIKEWRDHETTLLELGIKDDEDAV